jgi:hypothetical protein
MPSLMVNLGVGKVIWSQISYSELCTKMNKFNEFGTKLKEDPKKKDKIEFGFEGTEVAGIKWEGK